MRLELDGEILVDGGSFGANGFHLPFNPDAVGRESTGQLSSTYNTILRPDAMFDGVTTQSGDDALRLEYTSGGGEQILTWELPQAIENVNTFEIWAYSDPTSPGNLREVNIGGDTYAIPPAQSTRYNWEPIPVAADNTFKTMTYRSGGNGAILIGGVRINGNTLFDHSNIGNDASGQGQPLPR